MCFPISHLLNSGFFVFLRRNQAYIKMNYDLDRWPASLLKMSPFHRYFSNILLVKTATSWFIHNWNIGRKWVIVPWIFSNFSLWGESVNKDSIIMISKEYHCMINLGIACNFYVSIDPVYPGSCARRSIVVTESRGIWVPPSP